MLNEKLYSFQFEIKNVALDGMARTMSNYLRAPVLRLLILSEFLILMFCFYGADRVCRNVLYILIGDCLAKNSLYYNKESHSVTLDKKHVSFPDFQQIIVI